MSDRNESPVPVRVAGSQFRHDGEEYLHGEELDVPMWVYEAWAPRLDRVGSSDDEPSDDIADDGPVVDPHPSELTVAELRERIADVDNAALLRAIREAEADRDEPRSTAVAALDERLAALED